MRTPRGIKPVGVLVGAFLALAASGIPSTTASPLSATGSVTGALAAGETVHVSLAVQHTDGWQQISEVEVDLTLRGRPLEQLVIDPTNDSVVLVGVAGPVALGQPARFVGSYFRVDPATIGLTAKGQRLTLAIPIDIRAAPPPGARLTLQARGFDVTRTRPLALTAPVNDRSGFSWGTLGVAVAAALFLGGVVGGTFASRRRPPQRPSVYAAVRRRLDEERASR